ncbi:hypothetical protein ACFY03_22500 [Micromonospora chersina]|uniref:hypothetical protein n=1 Tax=Micromonospora chersina TaxID=47854 RepID=UPI0036C51B83
MSINISKDSSIKVGILVASGIAINKLSELFDLTAPAVILGSAVVLVVMLLNDSTASAGRDSETNESRSDNSNFVKFCLSSLLMGSIIAAVAMLPVFNDRKLPPPIDVGMPGLYYHLYEAGAAGFITLLAIIAAIRRRSPLQIFAFLASATAGMTFAMAARPVNELREEFQFANTFMTWLALAALTTFLVYELPAFIRIYSDFWFRPADAKFPQKPADHDNHPHDKAPLGSPATAPSQVDGNARTSSSAGHLSGGP